MPTLANGEDTQEPLSSIARLTGSTTKARRYAEEVYARECLRDLCAAGKDDPVAWTRHSTFLLIKPDGIVARCGRAALNFLAHHGFMEIGATRFRFDRLSIRELWRYQLNLATAQRLDAIDFLLPATDSVLVLLRHEQPRAAELLSGLKGSARANERSGEQLRSVIRAGHGLLNFVHTPDDGADVLRELGVLLNHPARRRLIDGSDRSADILQAVYDNTPANKLIPGESLDRLQALCPHASSSPDAQVAWSLLDQAQSSAVFDWQDLFNAFESLEVASELWDRIVVACAWTKHDRNGVEPVL